MSGVHLVLMLSVMSCVICSVFMFVVDASGDDIVEAYSSMGLVIVLYVTSTVSFCFPHVVKVSALSSVCVFLLCYLYDMCT